MQKKKRGRERNRMTNKKRERMCARIREKCIWMKEKLKRNTAWMCAWEERRERIWERKWEENVCKRLLNLRTREEVGKTKKEIMSGKCEVERKRLEETVCN